jgi:CheY-like chemotaxis protein
MKATCASCSNVVTLDDNNPKIPDGPFNVKCPKCQQPVRFAGKKAAAAPASPSPGAEEVVEEETAQEEEVASGPPAFTPVPPTGEKALVAMNDKAMARDIAKTLKNLGYTVDAMSDAQALRFLDLGTYAVVAMQRMVAEGAGITCYQKLGLISADARRSFFLILVGQEYTTGDATQAFVVNGDLVVHSKDAASCEVLVRDIAIERNRVFRVFVESKRRADAVAGY